MRAVAKFLARVNVKGRFPFIEVEIKKGRPIAVENVTQYYARYTENGQRKVQPLGSDLNLAFIAFQNIELNYTRLRSGLAPIHGPIGLYNDFRANDGNQPNGVRIVDAVAEYKAELLTLDKAPATVVAYRNALDGFVQSYRKTFVHEIDRKDILDYMDWLRVHLKKRKFGEQNQTIRNRLTYLGIFLQQKCGLRLRKPKNADAAAFGLLFHKDLPRYTKRTPDKYSTKAVNALLAFADVNERFLLEFFLYTGCRDEEIAHLEWSDFNAEAKSIRVQPKPHYNWKLKDHEVRDIKPLPTRFVQKIIARRDALTETKCNLIFPSSVSKPDMHLVKVIQRVAKRAGLEGRFTLHKLRRTYATMMGKQFDLQTVQRLLGHSDLETTARYLASEDMETEAAQSATDTAFSGVAD